MTADIDAARAGAVASLEVTIGRLIDRITRSDERDAQLWQHVHPVPILANALMGVATGTIDQPERLGPKDPFWWDVRRLSVWGFTAGTVQVFLNDASGLGELLASFPQAGQFTWSGQLFLGPRDRLVITATGITGNVFIAGQAIEVASTILPQYML
jgi:hypothetical protein